jgi:hypothetical protein
VQYRLNYVQGPKVAVAAVTALLGSEVVALVLEDLADRTRTSGARRLLIDLLDVPGTLSPREHERMGRAVAQHLWHLEKIASLVPTAKMTRVSETTAKACGVQLRVFDDLTEAIDWLSE